MSYIVIGQENHPDKFIEDVAYGHFEDYEAACKAAEALEEHSRNIIPGYGKKYYYYVREVEPLPKV